MSENALKTTPLHRLHQELGAKLVPFAGYEMPVQYPLGIMKEHLHTRAAAGLFDVSHMGQAILSGDDPAASLEKLTPGELKALKDGRMRYTLLMNDQGGIRDDLMVTRIDASSFFLVVNAACKDADFAHIETQLSGEANLMRLEDRALLALQGPQAAEVLVRYAPEAAEMPFMSMAENEVAGLACRVSRLRLSALARATHCAWKRACAFMATISMRRPRPLRPIWFGRSANAAVKRAAIPATRSSPSN